MRRCIGWLGAIAVMGLLILAVAGRADEEKLSIDKLPKAVVDALKERFPGAELKGAEKEKDGDKITYDVELKHQDQNFEVAVTPQGEITTIERQIAAKDLPKEVTRALRKKFPKATYKMIEEVYKVKDKKDKLEYYEIAVVTVDNKKLEVLVAPDGKIVKADEEKAKAAPAAEKIALDKVPQKIMAAVQARFPGAKLTSVETETEEGQVVYDIELKHKGRKYEMDIKADGTVIEIEKEVAAKDLPEAVIKALRAKYPNATIEEIMEVNKVKGTTETPDHYEVVLETADKKKLEIEVSLEGKFLKGGKAEGDKK